MRALIQDVQFSFRLMRKQRALPVIAMCTLALGIGANTLIFSVVSALLLRPLPFPDSDRIVVVWHSNPQRGVSRGLPSPAEFSEWRLRSHCFEQLSAWRTWFSGIGGPGEPEQVWGVRTSSNFFDLLRAPLALGRAYSERDDAGTRDSELVISHRLWVTRFAGDPSIIGRAISVDGRPLTVIGVLRSDFQLFAGRRSYDVWTPYSFESASTRWDDNSIIVFGRLKNRLDMAAARQEMSALGREIAAEHSQATGTPLLLSLRENDVGDLRPTLGLLAAAVGLVLLVACANVAHLLLTRTRRRRREIAIQLAVGASQLRIVRQWLAESLVISLAGCACGLLLAQLGLSWLHRHPGSGLGEITYASRITLDARVLGFTILVSLLTGMLVGCIPAWDAAQSQPAEALQSGSHEATPRMRQKGRLLAGAEVAVTTALLVAAALVLTGLSRLLHRDLGFDPHHVLTARMWMPKERYASGGRVVGFLDAALDKLQAVPQVESASAINFLPFSGWGDSVTLLIAGRSEPAVMQYRIIDPLFFRTVGMTMEEGREPQSQERGIAVINETAARRFWPAHDVLGRRVNLAFPEAPAPWRPRVTGASVTIVGVARDTAETDPSTPVSPQIFLLYRDVPSRLMTLVLRTKGAPMQIRQSMIQTLHGIEWEQPVDEIKPFDEFVWEAHGRATRATGLLSVFAALSLIIAAAGVYGVLSYSVVERGREIGVRMAVGARSRDVLVMIMREGGRIAVSGVAIGALLAWMCVRAIAAQMPDIASWRPAPVAAVGGVVALTVMIAVYLPARRATQIDPIVALRAE